MSRAIVRSRSTLLALLGIAAITLVCYRVIHANATVTAILLLLGVLLTGAYAKLTEAIVASVTATLCLDYFFVPPIASITIGDPQGWIALTVFLSVSLVATNLSRRLRMQRDLLISQHTEAEKLHTLSQSMLFSEGALDVRRLMLNKCMEVFGFTEAVLFESSTGQFHRSHRESSVPEEAMRRAAQSGSVDRNLSGTFTVLPISLGNKTFGSLGFRGLWMPSETLHVLGNTIAVAFAQAQAQEAASRAEAVRKSEELKSLMIDALAHDLKTPLTAIELAADVLLQPANISAEQRSDLLEVVRQEAHGLRRMIGEAIHLARIDTKKLKLECEPTQVRELIEAALRSLGERSTSHQIGVELPPDLPLALVDRELIAQALKQLLDNALKYSPSRSSVLVSAEETDGFVSIFVRDQGQGLTELEQGRVFDKFYRGQHNRSAVQGTGMGLAIVKEIAEAHAGSVGVESQVGRGSRFAIALPAVRRTVELAEQHA